MIRDTFEANPGLCELFKRRILDKAHSAGLSKEMIDFESQIDMKGTFRDNLRTFYREYPQLAQDSDYLRLKSLRQLSEPLLEQSWRNYERRNRHTEQPVTTSGIFPALTVSYSVGGIPPPSQHEAGREHDAITEGQRATVPEANSTPSTHTELMRLLLNRVASVAGEKAAKTILHQLGREIGSTAFHHSRDGAPTTSLFASLDHALRTRGLGRVVDVREINHYSDITYVCSIEDCSLCRKELAGNSTCSFLRGMITRWFESHLQKKAETTEGSCVDGEPHRCIFRVKFRR